ncbi:MAG: sulfatase-like hydrolase/transferase [Bacteroidetes bacterium]|nr:sulfatase-like hydrolase/transferase [Bacteroidota bacterium]
MTKYYPEGALLLLFLVSFLVVSCRQEGATDVTEPGTFTSGVEGPAVDHEGNLYAVNYEKQGTIGKIFIDGHSELFVELPERSIGNGIRFDNRGNMYVADYTGHNILKVDMDTREVSVFAHQPVMNQPNDLAIDGKGRLYASDPNWSDSTGMLWRIDPDGSVHLLEKNMGTTNGVEVSADEKHLYVNESIQRKIWVYNLDTSGNISNKRLFFQFENHGLDGMRCDINGNLYVTRFGKGTIVILSPEGVVLKEIILQGKNVTNIAFGGPDGKSCFVTVADRGCIETFRVKVPGRAYDLILGSNDPESTEHPNIILFLVDDMGWTDTSVPFWTDSTQNNKYQKTPQMERLAAAGMKFTNAYAASPVCSPTRTSLLTGKNPARSRITNWIPGGGNHPAENQKYLIPEWNVRGLHRTDILLPKILKENGYNTAFIGKAHFGKEGTEGADPHNLGFDISIAGNHRGSPGSYYVPYGDAKRDSQMIDLHEYFSDSLYLNEALTYKALRLIEKLNMDPTRPFFLDISHYAVHTPIQGHPGLVEKFREEGKQETQAQYASMIESVDWSLGKIMKKLEEENIAGKTVILFMSDNGGLVSHQGPPTTNYPLSSGKGSSREGGYRVPMIVYWPGVVEPGTVCHEPVISDDFFPTILHIAGIINADKYNENIDGKDLTPLLKQTDDFIRNNPLVWHYPHYWGWKGLRETDPTIKPFSAIRNGDWKLIYGYEKGRVELYNLKNDIGEKKNLLEQNREKADELCRELREYLISVKAQTPVDRETLKPVPYPSVLENGKKNE